MNQIYLDWAATTPMSETALEAYTITAHECYGNPSSLHTPGKVAHSLLASIRKEFARLLSVREAQLYFTSGGTESNALVCEFFLRKRRKIHVIMSGIEHPAIFEYQQAFVQAGHDVTILPAPGGVITPEALKAHLRRETALVLVMTVNNVLGTIEPLAGIRAVIDDYAYRNHATIHLHADSVQSFGKIPPGTYIPYVDSASFSAHKLQGPKGTGLLYCRKAITVLSPGGGQENGIRPGTEDLPSLAAFLAAAQTYHVSLQGNLSHVQGLNARMAGILRESPLFSFPELAAERSPYILCVAVRDLPAEVTARILNDHGICISTGSACSSKNRKKLQRVLLQSGIEQKTADSLIRISFGPELSQKDIETASRGMIEVIGNVLRQMGKLR